MLIKVRGELLVVDYIYRIGEAKPIDNTRYKLEVFFLNDKSIEFNSSLYDFENLLEEIRQKTKEFQYEKLRAEKSKEIKTDEWHRNLFKLADEYETQLTEPLREMIKNDLEEIKSFISSAIQKYHENKLTHIDELDFPKHYKNHE